MSKERFQKLLSFGKKVNFPFSSIEDFERLSKELRSIETSESSPPDIKELKMLVVIENSLLVTLCNYIFGTELYQTSLSDKELESFREFEKNIFPNAISYYKNSIVIFEKNTFFDDSELREDMKERKNFMSKDYGLLKSQLTKIIKRENARRRNIPNNNNLGDEIVRVSKQIKDTETKDLEKVWRLLSELKKKLASGEKNKNDSELFTVSFTSVIGKCKDFFDKWKKNEIDPTDKELENAKKVVKEVLDDVARLGPEDLPSNYFPENYFSEAKRELEAFEKKLKEKIPYQPDEQDSSEREINNLKSQIKALENKINNTPDTDANKQQYKREIQQLKARLEEKEKEKEKENKSDFPWMWAISIGGGVVIILLIILLIKKNAKS